MIHNDKLLSIIVPVYNTEKYLADCLSCLLEQQYRNIEIICINDGSTDQSLAILERYAGFDSRITILNQQNKGQSNARNNGLNIAKGAFITFVDADDYISPDALSTNIELLLQYPAVQLLSFSTRSYSLRAICSKTIGVSEMRILENCSLQEELLFNRYIYTSIWGKIFRGSFFDAGVRLKEDFCFEDVEMIYTHLFKFTSCIVSPYGMYYYRYNSDSITKSDWTQKKIDNYQAVTTLKHQRAEELSLSSIEKDLLTVLSHRDTHKTNGTLQLNRIENSRCTLFVRALGCRRFDLSNRVRIAIEILKL